MDRWSQNKADTAKAIWGRLLGCFGDALLRKFGKEPPEEWIAGLGMLTASQHERGLRRIVFGWKGGPPSLPDFMRLCRSIGNDEFDDGKPALPMLAGPETWTGDAWDAAASRYLMGYIATRMRTDPKCWGRPASYAVMGAPKVDLDKLGLDEHNLDAAPAFVERVHCLVAMKNAWAADMRDIAVNGEVPVATQQAVWRDYMAKAEAA